jgi:hypothetical protein
MMEAGKMQEKEGEVVTKKEGRLAPLETQALLGLPPFFPLLRDAVVLASDFDEPPLRPNTDADFDILSVRFAILKLVCNEYATKRHGKYINNIITSHGIPNTPRGKRSENMMFHGVCRKRSNLNIFIIPQMKHNVFSCIKVFSDRVIEFITIADFISAYFDFLIHFILQCFVFDHVYIISQALRFVNRQNDDNKKYMAQKMQRRRTNEQRRTIGQTTAVYVDLGRITDGDLSDESDAVVKDKK